MLEAVVRQAERDSDAQLARLQHHIQQSPIAAENRGIDGTAAVLAKEIHELGISWIATVPGRANRRHSANEYIQVKGYRKAIAFTVRLFSRIENAERS
jgi:acetylornithine deacetylase/succinyl-diaminopimelate desuccinylase-like protein